MLIIYSSNQYILPHCPRPLASFFLPQTSPPTPARHAPGTGPPPFAPARRPESNLCLPVYHHDMKLGFDQQKRRQDSKTNRDLSVHHSWRKPTWTQALAKKLSPTWRQPNKRFTLIECHIQGHIILAHRHKHANEITARARMDLDGFDISLLGQAVAFSDFCLAISVRNRSRWRLTRLQTLRALNSIQGFPPMSLRKFPFLRTKINKHLNNATVIGSFNLEPLPSWENRLSCPIQALSWMGATSRFAVLRSNERRVQVQVGTSQYVPPIPTL